MHIWREGEDEVSHYYLGAASVGGKGFRVRCIYVPFVYVKDGHAEYRDDADDDGGDDDAHNDGHVPTVHGGEHLSCDNAADDAVPDHEDGIENGD